MQEPTCQHPKACWYQHTSGDMKCMWCDDQERWAAKLGETVIARDAAIAGKSDAFIRGLMAARSLTLNVSDQGAIDKAIADMQAKAPKC